MPHDTKPSSRPELRPVGGAGGEGGSAAEIDADRRQGRPAAGRASFSIDAPDRQHVHQELPLVRPQMFPVFSRRDPEGGQFGGVTLCAILASAAQDRQHPADRHPMRGIRLPPRLELEKGSVIGDRRRR